MEMINEKINFQTTAEAEAVKKVHRTELEALAVKYDMSIEELVFAANNDKIEDQKDLFLIFKRSYLLSEQ